VSPGSEVGVAYPSGGAGSIYMLQRGAREAAGRHVWEDGIDAMAADPQSDWAEALWSVHIGIDRLANAIGNPLPAGVSNGNFYNLFTRKWPREIADDTDTGEDGQRARYRTTAQMYDHVGGAWVLSEDQLTPPDTVEGRGLCVSGDYVGPWIWNELWAVCKVMRWTMVYERGTVEYDWRGSGVSSKYSSSAYYDGDDASEALARSRAESDWSAEANGTYSGSPTSSSQSHVESDINYSTYYAPTWFAYLTRRYLLPRYHFHRGGQLRYFLTQHSHNEDRERLTSFGESWWRIPDPYVQARYETWLSSELNESVAQGWVTVNPFGAAVDTMPAWPSTNGEEGNNLEWSTSRVRGYLKPEYLYPSNA